MTTLQPTVPTINATGTPPWSYLGSVSSVSPVNSLDATTVKNAQDSYNGTGYYIDEDGDSMLSDLKTVVLACLATLLPLVFILVAAFGLRLLWIQYKTRKKARQFDGILVREHTSDDGSKPLHSHLLNDKASTETQLDINTEAVEICEDISGSSNRSNNANGSIITMTLKNNHLIVETEERNDIDEDSRETTMRYSPSARDGVFVVEVQQGSRRSPGSGGPTSFTEPDRSGSVSDQCALVHNPPEKFSDEETLAECDDSEYCIETTYPGKSTPGFSKSSKTGLSSSTTSIESLRQSYCYTNQQCYDHGSYGYSTYQGYHNNATVRQPQRSTKPKITSALYKSNARNLKSMSFDYSMASKERAKKKLQAENSSLDNVLESNGFEEFTNNLYKSKVMLDNKVFVDESGNSNLDVRNDKNDLKVDDTNKS